MKSNIKLSLINYYYNNGNIKKINIKAKNINKKQSPLTIIYTQFEQQQQIYLQFSI